MDASLVYLQGFSKSELEKGPVFLSINRISPSGNIYNVNSDNQWVKIHDLDMISSSLTLEAIDDPSFSFDGQHDSMVYSSPWFELMKKLHAQGFNTFVDSIQNRDFHIALGCNYPICFIFPSKSHFKASSASYFATAVIDRYGLDKDWMSKFYTPKFTFTDDTEHQLCKHIKYLLMDTTYLHNIEIVDGQWFSSFCHSSLITRPEDYKYQYCKFDNTEQCKPLTGLYNKYIKETWAKLSEFFDPEEARDIMLKVQNNTYVRTHFDSTIKGIPFNKLITSVGVLSFKNYLPPDNEVQKTYLSSLLKKIEAIDNFKDMYNLAIKHMSHKRLLPSIYRAININNYDAATAKYDQEKAIGIMLHVLVNKYKLFSDPMEAFIGFNQ